MNPVSNSPANGAFIRAVRRGVVKGPQQRAFNLNDWKAGFEEHGGGPLDRVLFISGLWFHTHFLQVRLSTETCAEAADLVRPLSLAALIAMANREWLVTHHKLERMLEDKDRFMFEELDQTPLQAGSGNPIYFTNAIETIVDGARFPLARAATAPPSGRTSMTDAQWEAHVNMFGFGGYYHMLEQYWMQCVWNGYGVEIFDHEIRIRPFDVEFHHKLTVTLYRRNARNQERAMVGASAYKRLLGAGVVGDEFINKPILCVFKKAGVFRVKADVASRFPDSRRARPPARMMVHEEHLAELTQKRFPALAGLSIDIISDAFELLEGLPEQIAKFVSQETALTSWAQAVSLVPRIRRAELASALRSALKLSEGQATFILDYATWKPDPRRELWFSPLIPLDAEFVAPVCLALEGVNTIRLCDQLIADFPVLKPDADRAFEQFLRLVLGRTFEKSKLAGLSQILPTSFKPKDQAVGDIDVLFRIGATIWVGEAKSATNIYSPIEDYRYSHMLEEQAVPQAKRKCTYVAANLSHVAPLLGIEPAAVQHVRPFVVTSNTAFAGFPINGVPVIDWYIVDLFFSEGSMRHFGYTTNDGRTAYVDREDFYKTPDEAEQRLPGYLENPPQVALPRKHVYEEVSEMLPSPFFKGLPVRVSNFVVKMPTEGMVGLIQRVAEARGDWRAGEGA